jgi:hypothetical protein
MLAAFGSIGVVHVIERRPVPYQTPRSKSGASLPAQLGAGAPVGFAGMGDDLVPLDAEAVRGVARAYRWDAGALRHMVRRQRETIVLEEERRRSLAPLVPGSFLDSCEEPDPLRDPPSHELPPVSAPAAGAPEPSRAPLVAVALAGLVLQRALRPRR